MEASTKDLRLHTKALIAATDRGEEVIITWRGKPRAKLVPLDDTEERDVVSPLALRETPAAGWGRNPAFGLWREHDEAEQVSDQVRRWRQPRKF